MNVRIHVLLVALSRRDRSLTTEYETLGKPQMKHLSYISGQATKGARWMPWHEKAMKDVISCDKPREVANTL